LRLQRAIVESGFSVGKLIGPGFVSWLLHAPLRAWTWDFPFLAPCGALALAQFLVVPLLPAETASAVSPKNLLGGIDAAVADADVAVQNRWRARHAQVLSACFVVVTVAMEECFVLYGVGALGISAPAVGTIYFGAGAVDLLLVNTVLIRLVKGADAAKLARLRKLGLSLYALPLAGLPFIPAATSDSATQVILLGLFLGVRNSIAFVFFVSNMSLLNEASPGAAAAAQSLRMAIGSAMQVVGPPLGASAYAWSATSGHPFPMDHHFTFLCAAACSLCLASLA